MSLLIESIKVKNGQLQNLEYHIARMVKARKHHFGISERPNLEPVIVMASLCTDDIYKCKIEYNQEIVDINFTVYRLGSITSLQLVEDDNINYQYKFSDRSNINFLFSQKKEADDVLIVKKGLLTDTSFCNIALYNGEKWFTPEQPLLAGTKRQELIDKGIIIEKDIKVETLGLYEKITLFNAMIEMFEVEVKVSDVCYT